MEKDNEREKKRLEFKIWASARLIEKGMTKVALAKELGIPVSRVSEAINGTGNCKKYILLILWYFGGDVEYFNALYASQKNDTGKDA